MFSAIEEVASRDQDPPPEPLGQTQYETIELAEKEWLSHRPPVIAARITVIEGETSIGKTTYILDHLARATPLILLLPTISQIVQIEKTRPHRALSVVHGNRQPEQLHRTIVATYDQLGWLTERLGPRCCDYWLVVDEVHKIYQAGHYRPRALQGILDALACLGQPQGFCRLIGLSTTIQAELLPVAVDHWIVVRKAGGVQRRVVIVEYEEWETTLVQTFIDLELLPPGCLNVIRLNHTAKLEELCQFFTNKGYVCALVNSQIQDEEPIQAMLANEAVADDCELLLTTSLLDEGINLNNRNLGCVHLIGAAHSAELRQFLGRFRQSNPELFLHVPKLSKASSLGEDLTEEWQRLSDAQDAMLRFCETTLTARGEPSAKQVMSYIHQMNTTHRRFYGFDLLLARVKTTHEWEVIPNHPGLLAYLYGLDTENHYRSRDVLHQRLSEQFDDGEIEFAWVGKQPSDQAIEADLFAAASLAEEQRQALLDRIDTKFQHAATAGPYASPQAALDAYISDFARKNTREASMIRALWELSTHVAADYETAIAILRHNQQQEAWCFVKGLDDALIGAFHGVLTRYRNTQAPHGEEEPLRIPRALGRDLVLQALADVTRRDPHYRVSAQLLGSKERGIHYAEDGRYTITPQFVTKLFRRYTDSDILQRHYAYRSCAWGGYRYAAFQPSAVGTQQPRARRRRAVAGGRGVVGGPARDGAGARASEKRPR